MKQKKLKPGKGISITWIDSSMRTGWVDTGDLTDFEPVVIKTKALVIFSSPKGLVLTPAIAINNQVLSPFVVPWESITKLGILG